MDDDQQFCLRWNNHQSTLVSVFDTLLEKGMHVDCTLAAEGQTLKAHKVVLSACSPYFENVLSQQYDKHPIIILKDVKYAELRAMMDYMYRGEVNISQDQLAALLKAAESLQIKGLSDNKPSRPPSRPTAVPAAHPPRAASPATQPRDGSIDSREGSISPTRRRKKARRGSVETPAAPALAPPPPALAPPPPAQALPPPVQAPPEPEEVCKEESARDGLEDLTIDEDGDAQAHNDVVRNFQWHMERSQDEIMNSSDSIRDTQEHKEGLPSALLSLLSAQRAAAALAAGGAAGGALQHALLNNNHRLDYSLSVKSDEPSDYEYDDTDDIVLPDDSDGLYEGHKGDGLVARGTRRLRGGSSSDDASRHFECRHCGKRYRWKSTLRRHENVECGGKPPAHQCPYCTYRAKQRGNLGVHIRKHHNQQWLLYASSRVRRNKRSEPV